MHKWLWVAALSVAGLNVAYAQDKPEDKVLAALKTLQPDIKIDEVRPAPIPGFYEVTLQGAVVYVNAEGTRLIQGIIFDIPNKTDLTEQRKSELRRGLLSKAPSNQRIVFAPKGEVKHRVAVFTDIDCGYCRELHKHMAEYNERGIQIEYLLFPRAGIGSDSHRKAVAAWCSKSQQEALTKAKTGEDPGNGTCVNPVADQYQLGQQMGVSGTPTLVFPDGTVAPGYVTPDQLEQRLTQAEAMVAAEVKKSDK